MLHSSAVRLPKRIAMLVLVFIGSFRNSLALNPSLDINQYAHHAWTIRDGFFKGMVLSIAQTPDGYLWLGTESGLLRFDGVRFVEWAPPGSRSFHIRALAHLLSVGREIYGAHAKKDQTARRTLSRCSGTDRRSR
jgi:ligand-binding sensor domain-containing protein